MWQAIEKAGFLGVAVLLHLLFFLGGPERGMQAAGAGGEEMVTILPASEQLETMVAEWQDAPDVETVEAVDPPARVDPDPVVKPMELAALSKVQRPTDIQQPHTVDTPPQIKFPPPDAQVQPKLLHAPARVAIDPVAAPMDLVALPNSERPDSLERLAPDHAFTAPPPPPEPAPLNQSEIDPETGHVMTSIRPRDRGKPSAHMLRQAPEPEKRVTKQAKKPARKQEPSKTAEIGQTHQKASQGSVGQKAAGSGGGTTAGNSGKAEVSTGVSKTRAASLQKTWGAKIRNKIERAKRYPPGKRRAARVTVALTVTRSGKLSGVRVAQSSGNPAFDQAAVNSVKRAGRFPAAPKGLTNSSYNFTVTLTYK